MGPSVPVTICVARSAASAWRTLNVELMNVGSVQLAAAPSRLVRRNERRVWSVPRSWPSSESWWESWLIKREENRGSRLERFEVTDGLLLFSRAGNAACSSSGAADPATAASEICRERRGGLEVREEGGLLLLRRRAVEKAGGEVLHQAPTGSARNAAGASFCRSGRAVGHRAGPAAVSGISAPSSSSTGAAGCMRGRAQEAAPARL